MNKRPIHSLEQLGPQRRRVADMLADGYTDKVIHARLGISLCTVRKHVWQLARQVGVGSEHDPRITVVRWVLAQRGELKDAA